MVPPDKLSSNEILQANFHFPNFRPLQEKIVTSIIEGHDTLALLPTGGGKSICYQVPGLYFYQQKYITLVISPLIALMKDQVDNLEKKGIPATYINHALSHEEIAERLAKMKSLCFAFIYVSPERLSN